MPDSTSIASEFSTRDFLRPWLRCMCSIRLCNLLTAAYIRSICARPSVQTVRVRGWG